MEDTYRTLEKSAEGMFRDRNSRFLAFGFPVETLEQINEILTNIRKRFHDARHHCYAYRIGTGEGSFRMNDDGEPSGTAGKPIYNQLLAHDLTNVLIVVVRYFGGTLLGTGGLIQAYKNAAGDMLSKAPIVVRFIEDHFRLTFPYEKLSAVMKILKEENLAPVEPVYDVQCSMSIAVRKSRKEPFIHKLAAISEVSAETL